MLELEKDADDDPGFVVLLHRLIRGAAPWGAFSFYVVKVDNWFGPKWLGFNHKILGAVGHFVVDGSSPRLVPPFAPSRILSTRYYTSTSPDSFSVRVATLHRRQPSEDNARRSLETVMPNDGAFWWSGASGDNGRGCVMAYLPGSSGHIGWYAGFKRSAALESWSPSELRGTTPKEIARYLDPVSRA